MGLMPAEASLRGAFGRDSCVPLLEIVMPGDPIPKGRPRHSKTGRPYTPERTRKAEKACLAVVRETWGEREPVEVQVGLVVEFFCATKRHTDGDNLVKLVTDAMNKVVYKDDSQIVEWFCRLHRGVGAELARTQILLYAIEPATSS